MFYDQGFNRRQTGKYISLTGSVGEKIKIINEIQTTYIHCWPESYCVFSPDDGIFCTWLQETCSCNVVHFIERLTGILSVLNATRFPLNSYIDFKQITKYMTFINSVYMTGGGTYAHIINTIALNRQMCFHTCYSPR